MLERRQFLKVSAFTTLFTIAPNLFFPLLANAEVQSTIQDNQQEKYHIFIGEEIIRNGGKQKVTLKSGKSYELNFKPGEALKTQTIIKPKLGIKGNEICLRVHVLSSEANNAVSNVINQAQLKFPNSKELCEDVYQKIRLAEYAEDLSALDLLDYLVATSDASDEIRNSYELASQNSRLIGIESAIEDVLKTLHSNNVEKKSIRATYQFVRAGEPIDDFGTLTKLDAIIETALIPTSLKRKYSIASATSRALTTDILIIALLNKQAPNLIDIYKQVRDGHQNSEHKDLYKSLDLVIRDSNLPNDAKVVYQVARDIFVGADKIAANVNFKDVAKQVTNVGAKIVPSATNVLGLLGTKAGTGAAISALNGGAALNSTLAFLGGGSLASGGLGMLGGLAVVTGGAALIGAAGLVSIALVSDMDTEDKVNLGMAGVAGTLTSATVGLVAWTVASTTISGTGAAAISATIAALGGISTITGGAAFIAFGAGYVVWQFLQGNKKRSGDIVKQLETRLYTLTEESNLQLVETLRNQFPSENYNNRVFAAPDIPLDKLANSLSQIRFDKQEKVLALIDTKSFDLDKNLFIFTDKRMIWKEFLQQADYLAYQDLHNPNNWRKLPKLFDKDKNKDNDFGELLVKLDKMYNA